MHRAHDPDEPPGRRRTSADRRQRATSIAVSWDRERKSPTAFVWRGRRWRIERIESTWVVETGWWSNELRVNRCYSRVVAEGRLFDLCFDRSRRSWFVDKVVS